MPKRRASPTKARIKKARKTPAEDSPRKASLEKPTTTAETALLELKTPEYNDDNQGGLILRKYYPPELSDERAHEYINGDRQRPIEALEAALLETSNSRHQIPLGRSVVHWFRGDLRLSDNTALNLASTAAQASESGVNATLIAMYLISPEDFEAHLTSPAKVDFILRSLRILQKDLDKLDIPLYIEVVECRSMIQTRVLQLASEWGANHVYANAEYEVDELRRDVNIIRKGVTKGICFSVHHDLCVVKPGELSTKSTGKQFSVYTPWFRTWVEYVHTHPEVLEASPPPAANPSGTREVHSTLFNLPVLSAPESKSLSSKEATDLASRFPAGEHAAQTRLKKFLEERIAKYSEDRNTLCGGGTSMLSVHLANGTLSARQAVAAARDANTTRRLNAGSMGIITWISEVAWRDFYKHVLCNWPHVCMNKPFKPAYAKIKWPTTPEAETLFEAWCTGRTGIPIVDAAMRELLTTSHMHNRARMIVASFLCKDLLVDWRRGERFFMEHLIDGDFASNNGGWGWSSGTGVDPQPWFRIFNPLRQSEKFDPEGVYIKQWVEELRGIEGEAVHAPFERLGIEEFKKLGYPKPCVNHETARKICTIMYKEALGK
ncbi:putative Deoxyribodipyrimidine photo-lyase [Morchella snyderi]|nr:putative Deoxyribodipyrimidine photo-lyase [Morchella snyderi]